MGRLVDDLQGPNGCLPPGNEVSHLQANRWMNCRFTGSTVFCVYLIGVLQEILNTEQDQS